MAARLGAGRSSWMDFDCGLSYVCGVRASANGHLGIFDYVKDDTEPAGSRKHDAVGNLPIVELSMCMCLCVCVSSSREFDYLNFMFIAYK